MIKKAFFQITTLLLLALSMISFSSDFHTLEDAKNVSLSYAVDADCEVASMSLYTFTGVGFKLFTEGNKEGTTFNFKVPGGPSAFYFVGPDASSLKSVILGEEKSVEMVAKCDEYKKASVTKSKVNKEYAAFLTLRNQLNKKNGEAVGAFRLLNKEDEAGREALKKTMAEVDSERLKLTSAFKSDFVNKIAAMFAYQSFQNNQGDYTVEMDYYADNFFNQVDFKDPIYNSISVVYEVFADYTKILSRAKSTHAVHKERLEKALGKLDPNSQAYKYALGAVVNTLYQGKHRNMPAFATIYVGSYYEEDKDQLGPLKMVVDQINANTVGAAAPDIVLNNPEEEEIPLSSLKGNVVLIDFWASWCGPCRRENPNVVRMYNKYKDKGFEIYGVSLDSKKDRWVKAIEADGLTWAHVSDLKGWQSNPAKVYGVRSIPTTVLIDGEGNIIARNLRGASLEAKLEELFD